MGEVELSLNSDTFGKFKKDFDAILKQTIKNMEDEQIMKGELSVKLSIELTEDMAPDFEARYPDAKRHIIVPAFQHEMKSVLKREIKKYGVMDGYYELVWDEETQDYTMRPVDNGQQSFFDQSPKKPCAEHIQTRLLPGNIIAADFVKPEPDSAAASEGGE